MSGTSRSIEEIKDKIKDGSAVVMTAYELCNAVSSGEKIKFEDVDIVTTATKGLMSGTSAIMAFRIGEPGEFIKVKSLTMNDIPCYVGPCPNETLGLVDLILYATDRSRTNPRYGAGFLLRDLVEGKKVHVRAETVEGYIIEKDITLDEIYFAQMLGIRHAFRNYNCFVNPGREPVRRSIFTVFPMKPNMGEATICGCGVVNPLENDPQFDIIGIGTPILVNGALGYVIGSGTRSSHNRPNLMTIAPLFDMKPQYMGGFVTSNGPEVICSIAAAIPVLNEKIFNNLKKTDKNVPLNVVDIIGRKVIATVDYGQVWHRNCVVHIHSGYHEQFCKHCPHRDRCPAESMCPTGAFKQKSGIDRDRCFNCGTCMKACERGVFYADFGHITVNGKAIPITLRQSDRHGAIMLMNELKHMILRGEFPLKLPVGKPRIYIENLENKRETPKKGVSG